MPTFVGIITFMSMKSSILSFKAAEYFNVNVLYIHFSTTDVHSVFNFYITCIIKFNNFWLVGCFGFNGPLRQYFTLYRAVSQREGERGEKG